MSNKNSTSREIIAYVVVDLNTGLHVDGTVRDARGLGRITARDAAAARARILNREQATTRYTFRALHAD